MNPLSASLPFDERDERSATLEWDVPIAVIDGARVSRAASAAGDACVQSTPHVALACVIQSSRSDGSRGNGLWMARERL